MWLIQCINTKMADAQFARLIEGVNNLTEIVKSMDTRITEAFERIRSDVSEQKTIISSIGTTLQGLKDELTRTREELAAALAMKGLTEAEIQEVLGPLSDIESGIEQNTADLQRATVENTASSGETA